MLDENVVVIGAVIAFAGTLNYFIHVLQGKAHPNRVTWFLWTLAPMVAFVAEIGEGVGLQSLMTFMAGFCPLLILIASFISHKALWKITKFDLLCGILSLVGLLAWWVSGHGDAAIVFALIADGLAAAPTVIKSYFHPETESWLGYAGYFVSAGLTLLTIKHWDFATFGFPAYILLMDLLLVLLIRFELGLKLNQRLQALK